jgi:hypothetical protein
MGVSNAARPTFAERIRTFMMRLFAAILVVSTWSCVGDGWVTKAGSVCRARLEGLKKVKSENKSKVWLSVCSEFS